MRRFGYESVYMSEEGKRRERERERECGAHLNLARMNDIVTLHLELCVLDDKCPYIIAKPVRV